MPLLMTLIPILVTYVLIDGFLIVPKLIVYFKTRKHHALTKDLVFFGLLLSYEILSIAIMIRNYDTPLITILILTIVLSLCYTHFYPNRPSGIWYYTLPFLQLFGIIATDVLADNNDFRIIILVVVASIINAYPTHFTKLFIFLFWLYPTTLLLTINDSVTLSLGASFAIMLRYSATYLMVVIAFYSLKKQFLLNQQLNDLNLDLKDKNQTIEAMSILEERNRIARDIHDTLGHTLTGAIIQLEVAKKMVTLSPEQAIYAIEQTERLTRTGFQEVKRALSALKPVSIENSTLIVALEALKEQAESHFHVTILLAYTIAHEPNDLYKVALYRIVQEAITNSIRHGAATEITITIEQKKEALRLFVTDNGKGCKHIKFGYGLMGMEERVHQLGGTLSIETDMPKGLGLIGYFPMTE